KLIDTSILDNSELEWLNAYHARVYQNLEPMLDNSERAWLREATEPLYK
ncbi:MAG: M24 family metallopeptidase C-terminal domain-containing protein, partial [Muribaculaceae bacterium]|nr:M24 family metallopeptidase C-terminal domain-containing protein [Muribaculaceae bacterium]